MIKIRAISAIIAIIGVVAIIQFGGYNGIALTVFSMALLGLYEYGKMALVGDRYRVTRVYLITLGLMAFTISIFRNDWILHSFVICTMLIFVHFLYLARDTHVSLEELVNKAGLSLLGILYAGVCPVYICLLARLSDRLEWFIFSLVTVFAGDTAAYFAGAKYGKTKLFPRISPQKSIEGAIASLFASVVVGLIIRQLLLKETDLFLMFALCILTSIFAQLGDLCESMIKRSFHAKDSGHIMPGHGGLLDRLDGLLFGAPFIYIYAKYLVVS
ncbi:MAG: phosphatidate cytidylyltransferase [Oligoflexia bacterium]|nr:phosphatidate cytidylyltransferase [Oligoflexia bacterium]